MRLFFLNLSLHRLAALPAVVPLLMQGMMELNRKRPADPIEFLSEYLQKHNPKKSKTSA